MQQNPIEREEKYEVEVQVTKDGKLHNFEAFISFWYDEGDYGNGHTMVIKSSEEPWGEQGYDIRYDRDFDRDYLMEYIMTFYSRRFDGKKTKYDTNWKLTSIKISEVAKG